MRRRSWMLLLAALLLVGCGGDGDRTVLVFAAASLTDAFSDLEAAFEAANPDIDVRLNHAGSSALREQILEGAPAHVFAAADESTMAAVVDAGLVVEAPTVFATNRLEIAVPSGNPAGVTGLADLADDDLLVGLCAEAVPCGRLAGDLLSRAGLAAAPDTREPDVRSLLAKIAADELDVGLVYVTDVVAAAPDVEGIAVPRELNVEASYPIARIEDSADTNAFVAFVHSVRGREILRAHGFGTP